MKLKVCKECGEKPESIQSITFRHGSEKYIDCRKCGIRILGRSDLQVVDKWNIRNTIKDKIMETITRYDIFDCPNRGKILTQQEHGFFVKLSDHQKTVEKLQQEMDTLEEEARTYAEKVDDLNDKVFKNSFTIVSLDEQIESLKCCGNCTSPKPLKCVSCSRNNEPVNINFTDNWESIIYVNK